MRIFERYNALAKEHHPIQFRNFVLSGNLWAYLADLNEQAQQRIETLITQLKAAEGITEALKATDLFGWTQCMNNIGHSDISITLDTYTHLKFEDAKVEFDRCLEA